MMAESVANKKVAREDNSQYQNATLAKHYVRGTRNKQPLAIEPVV